MIFFDKTNFPFRLESSCWKYHFPMFIDKSFYTIINTNIRGDVFTDGLSRKNIELHKTYIGILIQYPISGTQCYIL